MINKHNILVGVLGLALNKKGEFLITLRHNPEKPLVHHKWQIPGGKIEFGEQPEEALIREIQEELGVKAVLLHPYPLVKSNIWQTPEYTRHVVLLNYVIDIGNQPLTLDHENADAKWIHPENIGDFDHLPNVDVFINAAKDIVKDYQLIDKLS